MKPQLKNKLLNIVTVLAVTMFFSCQSNLSEIEKMRFTEKFPNGIAENFVLTYTDSAKVKAILRSVLNEDFSNQSFPYSEFPKGLQVDFFDDLNNKSTVTAQYGILYSNTNLVELRDSVVLKTHDGKVLETSQLFWDQKNEWVFTEKKFTFTNPKEGTIMNGDVMDFNKDFSIAKAHKTFGVFAIEDREVSASGEEQ